MNYYLRFGDIPDNEQSGIWNKDIKIGEELGVSVYPALIDSEGNIFIGVPLPPNKTTMSNFIGLMKYENRPCYLVTGKYIGKGKDNEPLIKEVEIIKELEYKK